MKRRRNEIKERIQREISMFPEPKRLLYPFSVFKTNQPLEDKRRFRFDKDPTPFTLDNRRARYLRKQNSKLPERYDWRIRFANPKKTLVCIRRKARREALFSLHRIGKGKSVKKIRKFTEESKISCHWR